MEQVTRPPVLVDEPTYAYMEKWAADHGSDMKCIAEVGCWFGGGTQRIWEGLKRSEFAARGGEYHCFDRWVASRRGARKAATGGVFYSGPHLDVAEGEDILPYFTRFTDGLPLTIHQEDDCAGGPPWHGPPPDWFILDACKQTRAKVLRRFYGDFVPKGTIITLLDLWWLSCREQRKWAKWATREGYLECISDSPQWIFFRVTSPCPVEIRS